MVRPIHISVPSGTGTWYPNDEDLSWPEVMGTDKCFLSVTNHRVLNMSCSTSTQAHVGKVQWTYQLCFFANEIIMVIRSPRKDWVKQVFSNNTVYEQRTTG